MDPTTQPVINRPSSSFFTISRAAIDIFPLCVAVIPWGILCGSLAIQVGLTPFQAQLMSLIVFAGAAQLAGISLIGAGSAYPPVLSSTFVISARHLLYSAVFQKYVKPLSLPKRLFFAFFLTDEMFALSNSHIEKNKSFNYLYAISTGIVFYLMWNLSTLLGVLIGSHITSLDQYGLEFAIAATFIALVIPSIKNRSTLISVITSGVIILILKSIDFKFSLIVATSTGMIAGYLSSKIKGES